MTVPDIRLTPAVGAAGRPLLVLGPSLGTSTILWEDVVPALSETYRVVAWDVPGHGASPSPSAPFTVGELADAVAFAVEEPRFFYAGVSLGGATGLELLLRHPERVDAAAILASGARLGEPDGWHARAAQVRQQGTSSMVSGSASRWFAPDSIARRPVLSGRLLHALQDADDEGYARCCEALAAFDVRDALGSIGTPVTALWGEFDVVATEENALEIARSVRDGRAHRIDGAAHLLPAERPDAVIAALRTFFDTTSGGPCDGSR